MSAGWKMRGKHVRGVSGDSRWRPREERARERLCPLPNGVPAHSPGGTSQEQRCGSWEVQGQKYELLIYSL